MEEQRKIDLYHLLRDILYLKNYLSRRNTFNDLRRNFSDFTSQTDLLKNLIDVDVSYDGIFIDEKKILETIKRINSDNLNKYRLSFMSMKDILEPTMENVANFFEDNTFVELPYHTKHKSFTEKEFFEILYDFLSQFGNNATKTMNNVLGNNRIEFGVPFKDNYSAILIPNRLLNKYYIVTQYKKYNSQSLLSMSHEFGHAYDYENFILPQQKHLQLMHQYSLEIPSCFFEFEMAKYLIDNHIDSDSAYSVLYSRLNSIRLYFNTMLKVYTINKGRVLIDGSIVAYEEELDTYLQYYLLDSLKYGLGYYFALILCDLYEKDENNTRKKLDRLISSRAETNLEDKINILGISKEDFISGANTEEQMLLIRDKNYKRYNINL